MSDNLLILLMFVVGNLICLIIFIIVIIFLKIKLKGENHEKKSVDGSLE